MTDDLSMPPKVAAAISKVQGSIKQIVKGEKNQHGNYNFASIDDFLSATSPLCAEAGLIIVQDEDSFEIKESTSKDGKPVSWLNLTYKFTLAHTSGETWKQQPRRSILVNGSMGSQAFGAAQSYVLKQFMRSLFQIATGDKEDLDHEQASNLPSYAPSRASQRGARPTTGGPKPKSPVEVAEGIAQTLGFDAMNDWYKSLTPAELKEVEPHKARLVKLAKDFDLDRAHVKL